MSRRPCLAFVVAALVATACTGKKPATSGSASASAAITSSGAAGAGADGCPRTGHWSACQVKKRLEQSGVAPRIAEPPAPELPKLPVAPTVYDVSNSKLAVYIFADTITRRRAAGGLDSLHFIPPTRGLTMRNEATVIENDNLLGLLFTQRDQQRERVSDALSAGPPQP